MARGARPHIDHTQEDVADYEVWEVCGDLEMRLAQHLTTEEAEQIQALLYQIRNKWAQERGAGASADFEIR